MTGTVSAETGSRYKSGARHAVITGVGGWVPPQRITNHQLTAYLDTTDEWIRTRTGISARHRITPELATSDLAVEAGRRAMANARQTIGEQVSVDTVLVATATPDWILPATAPAVAARLGLTGVTAYDIGAVCAGFVYGLATATGLIATGQADQVLLIGADTYSTIVDPKDRSTAIIFGDGAGAVLLRAGRETEPGAIGPCDLGSDGTLNDLAIVPAGGSRQRSTGVTAPPEDHFLHMRGNDVYQHAVTRMTASARVAVRRAGWRLADVDRFAPHQANRRISDSVADRLGVAPDRRLSNIAEVGNTAAASIPLLLAQATAEHRLTAGQRVLITAFGGGLAWGATTVVWPALATPDTVNDHTTTRRDHV